MASHTFSHYYCLEKGQDIESFRADLEAAKKVASKYTLNMESLVFPRNQFNGDYLSACKEFGIKAYRGNERSWIYRAKSREHESLFRRAVRLLDAYVNISGHNCHALETASAGHSNQYSFEPISSASFHQPQMLEPLRMRRILSDLTHAAQKGLVYHLWWHPHNFGVHMDENLAFLKKILDHYANLKKVYGMESLNMGDIARRSLNGNESYITPW